jgi:selenocysteine lyase/cysteine desulfurase
MSLLQGVDRRRLVQGLGVAALGVPALQAAAAAGPEPLPAPAPAPFDPHDWESIRNLFSLDRSWIHLGGLLFASHPTPVREAIERQRQAFDANPVATIEERFATAEEAARSALATYFGVDANDLALTDSTTMGIGLMYGGLRLAKGDEIVTSEHDHYSTHEALRLACERSGATLTKVRLYDAGSSFDPKRAVAAVAAALTPRTRAVALTWVHSCSGVRLPLPQFAAAIEAANHGRSPEQKILFCVDGVHGTGVENIRLSEMGCDFFAAGTHKWLFGPRGTGILWGRPSAQARVVPSIPTFSAFHAQSTWGRMMTPGGFHTFEHRWAVGAATELHLAIGKERIQERIHALGSRLKEGLRQIKGLALHTPMDPNLAAGIVCFEIPGLTPKAVVQRLAEQRIIATTTPYKISYARLTPGLLNTPAEVDRAIAAVGDVSKSVQG